MKITNGVKVENFVLTGSYTNTVSGAKGKFYEFSGPEYPLDFIDVPYDAYLLNTSEGNKVAAAATRLLKGCSISSNRTGSLYFKNSAELIGTCHGYGHGELTYYNGYNFYNAFYPAGYFSPPFGENYSIFKSNTDGYENLQNGSCNNLTVTEYNELFGIVSKTSSDSEILSSTLTANIFAPIFSPREACPPEVASTSYYDEFQFTNIAGTSQAIGGNNFYNGNPIPTALDSYDIKVNGRYQTTTEDETTYIVYTDSRPVPSYTSGSYISKLNNNLCLASLLETKVSAGRGSNGQQLIEAPDARQGAIGDQVSFAGTNDFYNWHFTFRENAETLPFVNNFTAIEGDGVRQRTDSEGTQLFLPVLSSEESYWQNRQCPDTVDYLPHTFGASIYACPSEHFDIPYYSAIRKFGFYGARFLNSCKSLNLQYDLNGVTNASEMPESESNVSLEEGETEPLDLDADGGWTFSAYNNLLKVAKAEENYANMYAFNKGFFIWANSGLIEAESNFQQLNNQNSAFYPIYSNLVSKFHQVFQSGLTSFSGSEPVVLLSQESFKIFDTTDSLDILTNNDEYLKFKDSLNKSLVSGQMSLWNSIEEKFSYYVSNGEGINDDFYKAIVSGREKRIRTRYFENLIRGNPIDLFPINNITYSFDQAKEYYESVDWGRKDSSFGGGSNLPEINRRFFEGAYGNRSASDNLMDILTRVSADSSDYYYPGFFQDIKFNKSNPTPKYVPVQSGTILDEAGRSFSPSGWLALGYNEVGNYDANFSCFTPIFIKQPLPKVFCKIGQRPTFRVTAVDYHTLPEDKINRRYPEVMYWASKLKLLDCNFRNLYNLKYKWYRIKKTEYDEALAGGNLLSISEPSNQTGDWACLEGDGEQCTLFHPTLSLPQYTGVTSEDDYTFIQGAMENKDEDYYYFSAVTGRFGVRISNISELNIENWLRFDISVKNGMNAAGDIKVKFEVNDAFGVTNEIEFTPNSSLSNYAGYQQDVDTSPETVIEQKIPPPNAGFGDVRAFRFIGPVGYIGGTRTYTPSSLKDTRGLREVWGHYLDYGQLVSFEKILEQEEGDLLYGYKHLPKCTDFQMREGEKGVKAIVTINGAKVGHWSLDQRAVASLDMKAGIEWDKLFNVGELYPPVNGRFESENFGIGHWQWGNNLGAIKRFGKFSDRKDIKFVGGSSISSLGSKKTIEDIKDKLISSTTLAGDNCGYSKYGLGRNMVYYLEAYERFYLICDPLKKKNVTNRSFICPGVRRNNSAIQYFWLGNPSNTYVKRRPMYGPYAYQWKMIRHNRDRNGNGMSEAFYSMGYEKPYSLMYDAPAIYGLYVKKNSGGAYLRLLKALEEAKAKLLDRIDFSPAVLKNLWWGERGTEGTSVRYGDISYSCDSSSPQYDQDICNYVSAAQQLAEAMNFQDHSCPQDLLSEGQCFDPCVSIRYGQGFFPGGKLLDLFSNVGSSNANDKQKKMVRIVSTAKLRNSSPILGDEKSTTDNSLYFRSPLSTPHSRISMGLKSVDGELKDGNLIGGISPCQDGGSDHCNYITPTLHLGISSYLIGQANVFSEKTNYYANIYSTDSNIREEVS